MEMKIPAIAITALVVITVLAGVLMPVLDDATEQDRKFTNEGVWRMAHLENGMEWDYANGTWELDDVQQVTGTGSINSTNALLGADWCIRANSWLRSTVATFTSTANMVVVTNDAVTVTQGNQATTLNMGGYGIDIDGDYILSDYSKPVYVKGDSVIFATGQTGSIGGTGRGIFHFEGTIDDGITAEGYAIYGDPYTDYVISNIVVDYTPVGGFDDLYLLNGITADVSFKDLSNTYTGAVSYSSYVVPYEVTAEKSVHFTDNQNAIFAAIPIMVIIALLIAVVAMVFRSRQF